MMVMCTKTQIRGLLDAGENLAAENRMKLDLPKLLIGQPAFFIEDIVMDAYLPTSCSRASKYTFSHASSGSPAFSAISREYIATLAEWPLQVKNTPFSALPCAAESAAENAQSDQRIAFSGRKGYNAQSSRREKRKHEDSLLLFRNPTIMRGYET